MELFSFSPSSSEFEDLLLPGQLEDDSFGDPLISSSSSSTSSESTPPSPPWESNDVHLMDVTEDEDLLFKPFADDGDILGALLREEAESIREKKKEEKTPRTSFKSIVHCNLCKLVFSDSKELTRHTVSFVKKNACCFCEKTFPNSAKLTIHHRKHIREKPFECEFCSKGFTHNTTLNRHRLLYCESVRQRCKDLLGEEISNVLLPPPPLRASVRRDPIPTRLVPRTETQCKVCDKEMFDGDSLRNHMDFYSSSRTCCRCHKVLGNKSKLFTHHRTHTKELPYSCSSCGKRFSENSTLRKHEATHGERKFSCEICGKSFVRKDYLVKHSSIHKQTYKCSQCSYVCHKEEDIRIHVDAVHSFE